MNIDKLLYYDDFVFESCLISHEHFSYALSEVEKKREETEKYREVKEE